jgi:hypothetical protein
MFGMGGLSKKADKFHYYPYCSSMEDILLYMKLTCTCHPKRTGNSIRYTLPLAMRSRPTDTILNIFNIVHKPVSAAYGTIIYACSTSCSVTTLMLLRFIKIQCAGIKTQYSFKLP